MSNVVGLYGTNCYSQVIWQTIAHLGAPKHGQIPRVLIICENENEFSLIGRVINGILDRFACVSSFEKPHRWMRIEETTIAGPVGSTVRLLTSEALSVKLCGTSATHVFLAGSVFNDAEAVKSVLPLLHTDSVKLFLFGPDSSTRLTGSSMLFQLHPSIPVRHEAEVLRLFEAWVSCPAGHALEKYIGMALRPVLVQAANRTFQEALQQSLATSGPQIPTHGLYLEQDGATLQMKVFLPDCHELLLYLHQIYTGRALPLEGSIDVSRIRTGD